MAIAEAELRHAIKACYESVLDPKSWAQALHRLARTAGAAGCTPLNATHSLAAQRRAPHGRILMPPSSDLIESTQAYLDDDWITHDLRTERAVPFARRGLVFREQELSTAEERHRHPYYQESLRPFDLLWCCAVFVDVRGDLWCLNFHRSVRQPPFSEEEAAVVASCAPELARVLAFAEAFGGREIDATLDAFDLVHRPALLLDWSGAVARTNAAATALFNEALFLRNGRLVAAHDGSNVRLQRLLEAVARHPAPAAAAHDPVAIQRPGRRPLIVEALPTDGVLRDALQRCTALLLITDLDAQVRPAAQILKATFGLTPAETRLARLLADGHRIETAADTMGIVRETARRHLKSVLAKTDTHRQSELVAMLMKLPRESA